MLDEQTEQKSVFTADAVAQAFSHIEQMWGALTKHQPVDEGTLIGLPYPYIVPSSEPQAGFVFDEMYYWDSYFIAQGLLVSGHMGLAEGMLDNLLYLMRKLHIIPNANRYYHASRSQPPLLTSYIFDIYERLEKDLHWLEERLHIAEMEYREVWTSDMHPKHHKVHGALSRYYDVNVLNDLAECESGWDMTTRFNREALSYLPVDLNCMLYKYEIDFARGAELRGDTDTANTWHQAAKLRADEINQFMWDEEAGFFFDYNYIVDKKSQVWSLAPLFALWSGLASPEQARRIIENIPKFLQEGGLTATAHSDEIKDSDIPMQWSYPNGWAPLHWICSEGLTKYGRQDFAEDISRRWIKTNMDYFEEFGVFREAYDVVNGIDTPHAGVYPPQVGFGWTNGVFLDLAKKHLSREELQKV
jgi:alpha,alpha-trehalase